MRKYLIEVQHGGDTTSCLRSLKAFLRPRKHLVTSVEWGCFEEENKAWLIVKTKNQEDALQIVPSIYRKNVKITRLQKFPMEGIVGLDAQLDQKNGHGFTAQQLSGPNP